MSLMPAAEAGPLSSPPVIAALRPSEYTAALIQALHARPGWVRDADAVEIGSGSGVVLAAIGAIGAATLCGVDIEGVAVASGNFLLHEMGFGERTEMLCGDMWRPLAGRRFDLVAANLPQFPMSTLGYDGRLPSWSCGGSDGRFLLDPLLAGLAAHLAPGGRAVITHNGFIGLDRSRAMLRPDGLALRVAATRLVPLPDEKLDLMTPAILRAEKGRSIHRYGPHTFIEMHVVEIGSDAALA
ncbi:MAG: hypothetical protein ACREFB_20060 [Stellaceae bacterium]